MNQVSATPFDSPKQAPRITLVPNRDIQQRHIAALLRDRPDGSVCIAPPVFVLSVWMEEMAVRLRQLRCMDVPRSLDAIQALLAWMPSRDDGPSLRAFEIGSARKARDADRLLTHWLGREELPWLDESFYRHRQRVREMLERKSLFSADDWISDLAALLDTPVEAAPLLPKAITLAGFIELTPLEETLFGALRKCGVRVHQISSAQSANDAVVAAFETPEDEWRAAAYWVRSRLACGAQNLCVVVPDGGSASGPVLRRVRRTLSAVLHGKAAASIGRRVDPAYYLPSGSRLSEHTAMRDALLLLRLSRDGLDHEVDFPALSQWLLSPHWVAADHEGVARARLELRLRERDRFRLSLREVMRMAASDTPRLVDVVRALPLPPAATRAGEWFHAVLRHWGWPGPVEPNLVRSVAERLQGLLEGVSEIGFESLDEAHGLLESLCAEITVPTGGGPLSPVQVLGPEVAAAGRFEGIWACHLDDTNWPPPVRVNPFLPAAAREAIPRENPQGQLEYYERLTTMLCHAAPEVRLSWSRDGGEGPRNVSPLTAGLAAEEAPTPRPARHSTAVWPQAGDPAQGIEFDSVEDSRGLPFPANGPVSLPGGADFFRMQAACPMAAYLRWRLAAQFPAMPGPFASAVYRGTLLHEAMRVLYSGSEGGGLQPTRTDVRPAVDKALERLKARQRLGSTGCLAESNRLQRALGEWLETDSRRGAFEVAALEAGYRLGLGRAEVRVRIDRVDRLSDGRRFLIDYKSGRGKRQRAAQWTGSRIQEPQLPLYAVLLDEQDESEIGGIAIGVVRVGDCGLDGFSDEAGELPRGMHRPGEGRVGKAFRDWHALKAHWRSQVMLLCDGILAGVAENQVHDADVLAYSGLGLILRHEHNAEYGEQGDDG